MAISLLEAARGMAPSRERGIIEIYASENPILSTAPVLESGATHLWKVEDRLPYTTSANGTRAVNADFTASQGATKAYEGKVKIYGGKIQVDRYIQHNYSASVVNDEMLQIKAMSRQLFIDIFEGAGGQYLRGIADWTTSDAAYTGQVVDAGASTTPVALTLDAIDELLSKVNRIPGKTVLYMNDTPYRTLQKICRGNVSTGPNVVYGAGEIGRFDGMYDGVPIVVTKDGKGDNLLSITELDKSGGSSNSQSIYAVTWSEEMATLFSSNSSTIPQILAKADGSNYNYEVLEWFVGFAPQAPRSVARMKYVKNATA